MKSHDLNAFDSISHSERNSIVLSAWEKRRKKRYFIILKFKAQAADYSGIDIFCAIVIELNYSDRINLFSIHKALFAWWPNSKMSLENGRIQTNKNEVGSWDSIANKGAMTRTNVYNIRTYISGFSGKMKKKKFAFDEFATTTIHINYICWSCRERASDMTNQKRFYLKYSELWNHKSLLSLSLASTWKVHTALK